MDEIKRGSPLAEQLQTLIDQGLVTVSPMPLQSDFPSARIIVPVYDSDGTDGSASPRTALRGREWQTGTTSSAS